MEAWRALALTAIAGLVVLAVLVWIAEPTAEAPPPMTTGTADSAVPFEP